MTLKNLNQDIVKNYISWTKTVWKDESRETFTFKQPCKEDGAKTVFSSLVKLFVSFRTRTRGHVLPSQQWGIFRNMGGKCTYRVSHERTLFYLRSNFIQHTFTRYDSSNNYHKFSSVLTFLKWCLPFDIKNLVYYRVTHEGTPNTLKIWRFLVSAFNWVFSWFARDTVYGLQGILSAKNRTNKIPYSRFILWE